MFGDFHISALKMVEVSNIITFYFLSIIVDIVDAKYQNYKQNKSLNIEEPQTK